MERSQPMQIWVRYTKLCGYQITNINIDRQTDTPTDRHTQTETDRQEDEQTAVAMKVPFSSEGMQISDVWSLAAKNASQDICINMLCPLKNLFKITQEKWNIIHENHLN